MKLSNDAAQKFYAALIKTRGDINEALLYADRHYDLNAAATPGENDAWHEALDEYRANLEE